MKIARNTDYGNEVPGREVLGREVPGSEPAAAAFFAFPFVVTIDRAIMLHS
jgi:hypothetical protein